MGRSGDSPEDDSRSRGRSDSRRSKDSKRSRKDKKSKRDRRGRRDRDRSYSRSRSRSQSPSPRSRNNRDRKRRRVSRSPPPPPPAAAAPPPQRTEAEQELHRQREQEALDEEMEKRRRRVEAWQAQRRKLQAEEEEAAVVATAQEQAANTNWNLEDEDGLSSDGEEEGEIGEGESDGRKLKIAAAVEEKNEVEESMPPPPAKSPALKEIEAEKEEEEEEEEEEDPLDAFMKSNAAAAAVTIVVEDTKMESSPPAAAAAPTIEHNNNDDEIDPLDAFMAATVLPEVENMKKENPPLAASAAAVTTTTTGKRGGVKRRRRATTNRYGYSSEDDSGGSSGGDDDDDVDGNDKANEEDDDDATWARKVQTGKLSKGDKLGVIDHSTIEYPHFRRNFYIEVSELAHMSTVDVQLYRTSLDGIKVRGSDVPKPVKNWNQCGLSARVLETLRRFGFEKPLPIQAQALPVIMSGRDCMGIAKTGSGKTLAFVLPLIRHVKDQPPLSQGDGPIGLIMAPTRELVTQIGKEVRRFARAAGLECTCVYGGSGVANQISELKRGTHSVVCTPGRMIDILATGSGKITNLRRVTYLVLDEADRMFDMGFEPQIMRIVNNVRPDKQTVLFSATFPRSVETLARKILNNPVEIQVGGRSVVNSDITQYVEIRREEDRFLRLLEVLGEWYERGKILIFVSSQDRCDFLFRDLLRAGYPCLSLHGGKDQSDRESTIADFKSAVCNVLVATSVAARGLDVKDLVLVVNYDCPNHHEDYVHRVGRTGRAGAKGTAITFIAPDEEQYAPDLVKALKESSAPIPVDLAALAAGFDRKRKEGLVKAHGSGFGGSGFKFNEAEDDMVKMLKRAAVKEFGIVEASDSDEEDEGGDGGKGDGGDGGGVRVVGEKKATALVFAASTAAAAAQNGGGGGAVGEGDDAVIDINTLSADAQSRIKAAQSIAEKLLTAAPVPGAAVAVPPPQQQQQQQQQLLPPPPPKSLETSVNPMLAAAQAAAQRLAMQYAGGSSRAGAAPTTATMQTTMQTTTAAAAPPSGVAPNIAAAAAAALQAMGVTPADALAGSIPGALLASAQQQQQQQQPVKHYEAELEINDFPQQARWKATHRETIRDINEQLGAAVVVKGRYYKPGERIPEGERKLYLHIAGKTPEIVRRAKGDIKRILEESTEKAMRREAPAAGRYSIM